MKESPFLNMSVLVMLRILGGGFSDNYCLLVVKYQLTFNRMVALHCISSAILWLGAVGSDVGQINEVALRRARLVLGWVPYRGSTPSAGNLSRSIQPPTSSQPGYPPWVGAMSTGQRAMMLCDWEVKAGMAHVWCQVKLCAPLHSVSSEHFTG